MISSILHNFVEHTQTDPENKFNKNTSQNRNIINIEHTHTLAFIGKDLATALKHG